MGQTYFFTRQDRAVRREKLARAYQNGAELTELAKQFGYSMDHAYRIVRVAGVSRTRRAGKHNKFLKGAGPAQQAAR